MSNDTPTKQRVDETQECDMGALAYQLAEELDALRERLAEREAELGRYMMANNTLGEKLVEADRIRKIDCALVTEYQKRAQQAEQRALAAEALADERTRAAVAAERERCAKACEATHLRRSAMGMKDGYNAIMQCADAIRAAGK